MKHLLQKQNITIKESLSILSKTGEKCLVIVDDKNKFLGTLSDGDLRKYILTGASLNDSISDIYQTNCIFFKEDDYSEETAKKIFSRKRIDLIPIVNSQNNVTKIVFWDDLLLGTRHRKKKIKLPVVIMAGGEGTRLEPFTKVLPKPLMPVGEDTIIERIIEKFTSVGAECFYFTVNYKSMLLRAFFEELSPKYKVNFIHEKKPLGTAGGLNLLAKDIHEAFFISNCDIIVDCDYRDIYEFHTKNKYDLTLVASAKNYEIPYGTCDVSEGKLKAIKEKPSLNYLVNTGLYILQPELIKLIPKNKVYNMTDLIEKMLSDQMNIGVFTVDENSWIDIGQWAEYKKAVEILG